MKMISNIKSKMELRAMMTLAISRPHRLVGCDDLATVWNPQLQSAIAINVRTAFR
jgi:hypothetical protein